ncbi:uncharacterized protein [Rutidosis leptorrhynchoides]|uniref:uncharacterized protein n=1 Tax=Rutidosis leptorrhynchoides TaxID=125765 RepID=UPI003A991C68
MGACVSSNKKSSSPTKFHKSSSEFDRKTDNDMTIPPSPVKEKLPIVVNYGNVDVKPPLHSSANSNDFGSKEEAFFDSQAWLDSDCESDFMSVNGDFTPSRGNTPVHHNSRSATPQMKESAPVVDDQQPPMTSYQPSVTSSQPSVTSSQPSVSPIKKKKRLSELFSESLRENHNLDEENVENTEKASEKGAHKRAEPTAVNGSGLKAKSGRWVEIVHVNGCLPRVLSSCRPVSHQQSQVRRK